MSQHAGIIPSRIVAPTERGDASAYCTCSNPMFALTLYLRATIILLAHNLVLMMNLSRQFQQRTALALPQQPPHLVLLAFSLIWRLSQLQVLALGKSTDWKQHALIDVQLGILIETNHFNCECYFLTD